MLKKILCLLMSVSMLFLFGACGDGGVDANIYFPIDNDPLYLDPQVVSDLGAKNIIANCFEGLVTVDSDGRIAPGTAERWEISEDNLTYTFYLRKDCKWAIMSASSAFLGENFREEFDSRVTAHDFVFGMRRALLPETLSPGAKNLFSVKNAQLVNSGALSADRLGVKAIDDYTLTITLTQADPDFLYVLLEPECMPCNQKFFEATGGRYGLSTRFLMYNGPFYMSNWADDTSITLMKNDDYYDYENVKPYSIYFSINSEQSTRLDKITDEIYDIAPLTAEQAEELSGKRAYTVKSFDSSTYCLAFNCNNEMLKNLNLRKAIASSFDRELFYSFLGESDVKGILPSSMLLSGTKYRDGAGALSLTVEAESKELFEKSLEELELSHIELTVLCTREQEEAVRNIMQKWQATLGVKFNVFIEISTANEIHSRLSDGGDWQIAFTDITFNHLTAFNGLLQFTSDSSENILGFSDKTFDRLVGAIKTTAGIKESIESTKRAEQYLLDQCALIPLYDAPVYYGLGKGVQNVCFNTTGDIVYFRDAIVK